MQIKKNENCFLVFGGSIRVEDKEDKDIIDVDTKYSILIALLIAKKYKNILYVSR